MKAKCMNCNSVQKEKDIHYLGDQEWRCPNCDDGVCYCTETDLSVPHMQSDH